MKEKIAIIALALLSGTQAHALNDGFNFGTCSGSGSFEQQIHQYKDYEDAAIVGEISAGIQGLQVNLTSDKDVDIRLYANEDKIVHWPYGILRKSYEETKAYSDVMVTYSGYNGVNGELGHEFIRVEGSIPTVMTMKAFGYRSGFATVNYSWTGKDGCNDSGTGTGTFTQEIKKDQIVIVGSIPADINNLYVSLTSDKDLDIQLYGADGTAIIK